MEEYWAIQRTKAIGQFAYGRSAGDGITYGFEPDFGVIPGDETRHETTCLDKEETEAKLVRFSEKGVSQMRLYPCANTGTSACRPRRNNPHARRQPSRRER